MSHLPNGDYRTEAGSTLNVSGKHGGILALEFDWCEEKGACIECKPCPDPIDGGDGWYLTWYCSEHEGGEAKLLPDIDVHSAEVQERK